MPVDPPDRSGYSPTPFLIYLTMFFGISAAGIFLVPSSRGIGTHESMGLPPCGFLTLTGIPCPSCGLTTSFAHFLHGHFQAAFVVQPFGFIFYVTLMMLAGVSLYAVAREVPFSRIISSARFEKGQFVLLIIFVFSWFYKIWSMKGTIV